MDLTISNGTPIIISLLGIMRDPKNFPQPEKFMPDRYNEENPQYNPAAFIPFGDGPRSCVGNNIRFSTFYTVHTYFVL